MKTHILGAKTGRTACGRWLCMSKLDMTTNPKHVTCTGCRSSVEDFLTQMGTKNAQA